MADADKYLGKYDRTVAEKYDEFLSELGVNFLLRKAATVSSPVFEVLYFFYFDLKIILFFLKCQIKCNFSYTMYRKTRAKSYSSVSLCLTSRVKKNTFFYIHRNLDMKTKKKLICLFHSFRS